MAKSLNRVQLIGHVGRTPDNRTTKTGKSMATLSLATKEIWKDGATGQKQEKTEWHNLVAYGKIADVIIQYVTKGALLYVEGKLETRKYTGKDGIEKFQTAILISEISLLSSPPQKQQQTEQQRSFVDNDGSNFQDDECPF